MVGVPSAASDAAGTVRDAARSTPAAVAVRVGILAYGLTHLLIAWLALQVAFGDSGQRTDQQGAFQTLAGGTAGRVLLWVLALGFAAVALWRAGEAAAGFSYRASRKEEVFSRVSSGAKAVIFAALTVLAVRTALGGSSGGGGQEAAAGVLGRPGGQWIVGIAGVVIVVVGAVTAKHGWEKTFTKDMTLPLDTRARQAAVRTGQVGTIAKGVVTALVGVLVVVAAVRFDPNQANGLDSALKTLAAQPFGSVLLVVVALGLAAFGVFCAFDARCHRV
ncbi:hypothetical protein PSU4_32950 [Pseudonocardia sulfidoxydans NBRC 16205]|uniref:DUF1206 domain-containing protein n=1 Tax=Pseudonocardia sulfidoxydans NBRC 16205 TaxID=1223511 RepID=A0A511DHS9_9PSEU|nr:DUF1206 domain-containing protein [Pseudonocardia sulfidoxydans]GEL24341.1 hypothetical protein PSU4_32950 [Pseudonocardia sulfidoxydans NBRC 16205]